MVKTSPLLFKTTSKTLDAIFKSSKAKLRIYDKEKIPDQSILFVANHFTRFETLFVPYILKKLTGKYPIIMAYYAFFKGKAALILNKLGAVSTKDPKRDQIFIKELLTGDMVGMIFPEGQMLKDKKLVEKRKYWVYNSGIRRAPHTGAARLALRAEFYREKIKFLVKENKKDELRKIKNYFSFTDEDIKKVIIKKTYIVPLNITYYPIRAENNGVKRLVELFAKNISERMDEELSVEGSLLFKNTDIDIRIGDPIAINKYISKNKNIKKKINDPDLYIDKEKIRKDIPFKRESIDLMYSYMNSIYGLTTVNQDHIFAHLLYKISGKRILEQDFKNKINIAIDEIKKLEQIHYHIPEYEKGCLETDDFNKRYEDFIESSVKNNLIKIENKTIVKNMEKLNSSFGFHFVRKENIIEVIKNEIQPLRKMIKILNRVARISSRRARKIIRNKFYSLDLEIFKNDYRDFYKENETKAREISSPFFLKRVFAKNGVILVHGYLAAPEEIKALGKYLYSKGYSVYGVRLRGHGTSPEDLESRCWVEWYDSVNRAYVVLKNYYKNLAIIGFSAGGCLSLLQAVNKGDKYKAVISINAPLKLQNIASKLVSSVVAWNYFLKKIHIGNGGLRFVENEPENPHINYKRNPVIGVVQLQILMDKVRKSLDKISIPALIIQGDKDPIVNPVSGSEIYNHIKSRKKLLMKVKAKRHGIVNGEGSEEVYKIVEDFLKENFK